MLLNIGKSGEEDRVEEWLVNTDPDKIPHYICSKARDKGE